MKARWDWLYVGRAQRGWTAQVYGWLPGGEYGFIEWCRLVRQNTKLCHAADSDGRAQKGQSK